MLLDDLVDFPQLCTVSMCKDKAVFFVLLFGYPVIVDPMAVNGERFANSK